MSKQRTSRATLIKATQQSSILKAEQRKAVENDPFYSQYSTDGIIEPPYPIEELSKMVEYSTILQQCIDAYKRNIVGFGYALEYKDDIVVVDETPEMKAEWNRYEELVNYINFDHSFEDVFAQAIEHREKTGNGYLEVIRDGVGLPVGLENVEPETMRVTVLSEPTTVKYEVNGKTFTRTKRFRKYVQIVGTKKIYFKQFGDPRFMDSRDGKITESHNGEHEANEILHLKIGDKAYGVPRWIGQLIHMYGARKAEELNYRYFQQGRHTPAAIVVSNGMLTQESVDALQDYANNVQGVENSHRFLIIEAEGLEEGVIGDERENVKVEIKPLAEILQQDALFLDYDEKSREKVQSAFRLPDLYVGRSKDFNRATADTARQVTEEQVFDPERKSLQFIINNILFAEHNFQNVVLYFKSPEISDTEEKARLLGVLNDIGGIAPNDVRDEVGKVLGRELEQFELPEADLPLALRTQTTPFDNVLSNSIQGDDSDEVEEKQEEQEEEIQKSLLNIMKDVRDVLEEFNDEEN